MKHNFKAIIFYIILIAIIVISVSTLLHNTQQEELLYSDIVSYFKTDSVISFTVSEDYVLTMRWWIPSTLPLMSRPARF